MTALLAAIPPPSFSEFHLGPLTIRMYGIMIGLGVLAATWLFGKLMAERDIGDTDDAAAIAVWGVIFGVIGARLYHVITDFQYFRDNLIEIPMVWKPGLGIPGGILLGTIAGVVVARRRGISVPAGLSCAAPAIPLGQSIARWGNYFNQELYGRETTLPWGLKVDPSHLVVVAGPDTLFHPTFLYESLWNLGLCLLLVWVFRNVRLQPGRLFPLYMIGYGVGRLWIEALRIDPANTIGPFRVNIWMSLLVIVAGAAWFVGTRNSTERWPASAAGGAAANAVAFDEYEDADDDPVRADTSADNDAAANDANDDAADSRPTTAATGQATTTRAAATTSSATTSSATTPADEKTTAGAPTPEKSSAKKTAAKRSATKTPAARKAAEDQPEAKKTAAKQPAAKKATAAKTTAKKTTAKKTAEKKPAAKKSAAKKSAEKKPAAKKSATKKSADE